MVILVLVSTCVAKQPSAFECQKTRITTTWELKPSLFATSFSRRNGSAKRPKMSELSRDRHTHMARKDA